MANGLWICLLTAFLHISFTSADTNSQDAAALASLRNMWQSTPRNWQGSDPCGSQWDGITCKNGRIIYIQLSSIGLKGPLTGDILSLTELQILDLSYNKGLTGPLPSSIGSLNKLTNLILVGCSFSGNIPNQIGSLNRLVFLSLNSNSFTGQIPPEIGYLENLYWLDLADNALSGTIPVSSMSTPGLDLLIHTKHFHFGNNQLSGTIPAQLFNSSMQLVHVLFDGNKLSGSIPSTLGLVTTLEAVRFDRNSLSGPVPSSINNLSSINELHLSNNQLTGPVPNLTSMNDLQYVDLSNNSFDVSDVPPWFSTLGSLTTLVMENLQVQGQLPQQLFSIPTLQTLSLRNNRFNGTLNMGQNFSLQLQTIDLQSNFISQFVTGGGYSNDLLLEGNLYCDKPDALPKYCTLPQQSTPYSTGLRNCVPIPCPPDQKPSPTCLCLYPYEGTLFFRAPSFSTLKNLSHYTSLEKKLMTSFTIHQLPVDSVSLSNVTNNADEYLQMNLDVFPANELRFNVTEVLNIGFILSNQTFKPPPEFGPFYFIGQSYSHFSEALTGSNKPVNLAAIVGAATGGSVLALLLIIVGVYAYRQKRKVKAVTEQSKPFASWDPSKSSGSIPQLKGARWFSYDELKKCTNNFLEDNELGSGGYGKVYRGILPTGQLLAIKRAQQGSMQGGLEFKTEIELLSRVHHKNLVSLLGFCFEQGEQMLVYEFIPNGSLKESLTGKSGVRLDWKRRLRVALGSARGLAYLHELASPPIVHRDIKSNNILIDDRLNAKVADFGLSKPMGDSEKGHVTTQVKGTMGYLDPEYYMTQQLTEKSDVYSFGVLMLEIITARRPIERGRYIVREVRMAMDKTKDLYGLHELLDPAIGLATSLGGLERFVDLAMSCVEESGVDRPTMGQVVKEIESIMQLAGMNPNADSASTSASYEGRGTPGHPYNNEAAFDYSGGFPPSSRLEPK
ncbi:hypothetical protein AAC387_Pa11g1831 [Persea americana]